MYIILFKSGREIEYSRYTSVNLMYGDIIIGEEK